MEIHIDNNKVKIKQYHERELQITDKTSVLQIYTNNSGIENNIGAAAYCSNTNQIQQRYLGKGIDHNVYAAEVESIGLVGKIIQQTSENYTQCLIHTDSQPAIKAIEKPKRQSDQVIIKHTLNIIDNIKKQKPNIKIYL